MSAAIHPPVLLVFSHLRWGFVFQRPQHLMSRLADRWQVLFVEEPVRCEGPPRLEVHEAAGANGSSLRLLVPHTPVAAPGFHDEQLAVLQLLVEEFLRRERLAVDVAWLYTPMALPLAAAVNPACTVYDCMDELAAFKDAPRQPRQRESALMKRAALVLTGGPSLYEAKRDLHPHVVCLPSAVDGAHYAPQNLDPASPHALEAERLQGRLPRPRLGFFGVIDERLDLGLVAQLADAHPDWAVVMAGPVVKIDPAGLPRRDNLHWLGMQPYDRLPHLLAGWDLALMPFALNESTRFISPTKTLEYMAGEKPVVSTPIRDVISLYGDAVTVAESGRGFVRACEDVLAASAGERLRRGSAMLNMVALHAWDHSADCVHALLSDALEDAQDAALAAEALQAATVPVPARVPVPAATAVARGGGVAEPRAERAAAMDPRAERAAALAARP